MKIIPMLLVSSCLACAALAQPDPSMAGSPLRGPEVPDTRTRTLVKKTMTGRLERLQVRPEVAALQELDLDEQTAEAAREIVDERSFAVTMMLVDELDRIKEMTDKRTAGDREGAQAIFDEMWNAFEPDAPRSPLIEPLKAVLDDEQSAALRTLVDEYWESLIDWELRNNEKRQQNPEVRKRVERRQSLRLFQREVQEGYEASLRRYQQAIDAVADAVEPTPEQRHEIPMIIIEHIKRTRLNATPEQRRATNLEIYRMLDKDRKEKLFEYMTRIVIPDQG
jgi:hypothetical protein